MATRPGAAPDFLSNPAWAGLVADACAEHAERLEKLGVEIGQANTMAPLVWMSRRAAHQVRQLSGVAPEEEAGG